MGNVKLNCCQVLYLKKSLVRYAFTLAVTLLLFQVNSLAQDGEALFKQVCAACHSTGPNRLVGPGLQGVTEKRSEEWLIKWTRSSQSLIKSGDKDAVAIFEQFNKIMMPDNNFTDSEIKSIFAYIAQQGGGAVQVASGAAQTETPTEVAIASSDNATAEEFNLGKNIFEGTVNLKNGGASCLSCHNVSYNGVLPGGLLAKDLTNVHSRFGGDAGIVGILNAPPFPAMTQAYKNNPITEQEINALTAFLNKVDKESLIAGQTNNASMNPFLLYGPFGLIVWLVLILLMWRKRKKNTVKLRIYERQLKSN